VLIAWSCQKDTMVKPQELEIKFVLNNGTVHLEMVPTKMEPKPPFPSTLKLPMPGDSVRLGFSRPSSSSLRLSRTYVLRS
jgi:hypothetical protein